MSEAAKAHVQKALASVLSLALCLGLLGTYAVLRGDQTFDPEPSELLTELPLVAYLLWLLVYPLRPGPLRWLAALLPLLGLYLLHDEFLVRWGDVPNFGDFALVADLFEVLGGAEKAAAALALALPLLVWLLLLDFRRPSKLSWLVPLPALAVALALVIAPTRCYQLVLSFTDITQWSNKRGAAEFGRLFSALMRDARRRSFAAELEGFTPLARSGMELSPKLLGSLDGRNVHIVVLESFVDLRLMKNVRFSPAPFAPELAEKIDPFISASISPVFGGETARAEFEVLCGVPSMGLHGLEFLGFSGHQTYCLPTILGGAGYRTVLTFPHGPVFFNTRRAYPGLGFQQLVYGAPFSPPGVESIDLSDQDYVFDGDLFPQNLAKVKRLLAAGKPFLNYVMTIYGHWPFDIDAERFRVVVTPSVEHEELTRIASQMRERSLALADYLTELVALDPRALIVFVGDHLPPLPNGKSDYTRFGYTGRAQLAPELAPYDNFLLVVASGKLVKLPRMRHFDLPHWLLNELSQGGYCREKDCDFGTLPIDQKRWLERYRTILGLAALPVSAQQGPRSVQP